MTHLPSVAALRPDAVLAFSGDDAKQWLSGQATNNLTPLFDGHQESIYTLFVTAKGRILADAWISRGPDETFFAAVPSSAVNDLLEHFEKYIIMEDVEIERQALGVMSIVGGELPAELASAYPHYKAHDLGRHSVHILVPEPVLGSFPQQLEQSTIAQLLLDAGFELLKEDDWSSAKVAAGEPRLGRDFSSDSYPQEAGLARSAVSFKKGCYIGQEVVCMLENRGKFRRQLVHLKLAQPTAVGTDVREGSEVVGEVTSSASWNGEHYAIAMLGRKALETPDAIRVGEQTPLQVSAIGQATDLGQ